MPRLVLPLLIVVCLSVSTYAQVCPQPYSDAKCSDQYNTPLCDWDHGDCCPSTCVDTASTQCGAVKGYACVDPTTTNDPAMLNSSPMCGTGESDDTVTITGSNFDCSGLLCRLQGINLNEGGTGCRPIMGARCNPRRHPGYRRLLSEAEDEVEDNVVNISNTSTYTREERVLFDGGSVLLTPPVSCSPTQVVCTVPADPDSIGRTGYNLQLQQADGSYLRFNNENEHTYRHYATPVSNGSAISPNPIGSLGGTLFYWDDRLPSFAKCIAQPACRFTATDGKGVTVAGVWPSQQHPEAIQCEAPPGSECVRMEVAYDGERFFDVGELCYAGCVVPTPSWLGDGWCNGMAPYNTAACNWDGGDCCRDTCTNGTFECGASGYTCQDPSHQTQTDVHACVVEDASRLSNGICDSLDARGNNYNIEACGWDGGDCCPFTCNSDTGNCGVVGYNCLDPRATCPQECKVPKPEWVGDGWCDFDTVSDSGDLLMYNTAACNWDGGDCCPSTCVSGTSTCGVRSQQTEGPIYTVWQCLDPAASTTPLTPPTLPLHRMSKAACPIGPGYQPLDNGVCDLAYNTAACGYDGGDCCRTTCQHPDTCGSSADQGCEGFQCCVDPSAMADCQVDDASKLGDGSCDPAPYNTAACNWDHGDCCQASCMSTAEHTCGDAGCLGFSCCVDPAHAVPTTCPAITQLCNYAPGAVATLTGVLGQVGGANGSPTRTLLNNPSGLVVAKQRKLLFLTDSNRIRRVDLRTGTTVTIAGSSKSGYVDAVSSQARFYLPLGLALSPQETLLYVADSLNHVVRVVSTRTGMVSTVAGVAKQPGSVDGDALTTARFQNPSALAVDARGKYLYVSQAHSIRQVSLSSGVVRTLAGSSKPGHNDNFGMAARFSDPRGLVLDNAKNVLYVADYGNKKVRRVEVWSGKVTTLQKFQGNKFPVGLALSKDAKTLFVSVRGYDCIKTVSIGDVVSTQQFYGCAKGDTTSLRQVSSVTLSPDDSALYIADTAQQRIQALAVGCSLPNWLN